MDDDCGIEFEFKDPSNYALLVILAANHDCFQSSNPGTLANLVIEEFRNSTIAFQLKSRATLDNGAVKIHMAYTERGVCTATGTVLIQKTPKRIFLVEGVVCDRGGVGQRRAVEHAVNSFKPKSR